MLTFPTHWPFAALGTFLPSIILLIKQGRHPAELESSWGSGISAVTRRKGGSPPGPKKREEGRHTVSGGGGAEGSWGAVTSRRGLDSPLTSHF